MRMTITRVIIYHKLTAKNSCIFTLILYNNALKLILHIIHMKYIG